MAGVTVKREKVLSELSGGRGRSIRIRLVEYDRGGVRLDVRQYFTEDGGQVIPTSKGVGLKPEHIPALRQALDEFETDVKASS